jgi:transporter family-2 protein
MLTVQLVADDVRLAVRPSATTGESHCRPALSVGATMCTARNNLTRTTISRMPVSTLSIIAILLGGAMISLQGPLNATLGRAVGSPVNAALISFLVGTVGLAVVASLQRVGVNEDLVRGLPWWAWIGGLCGAVFVTAAAYAAPRIGVASMLTLAVASQLLMAVVLDQAGAFGVPQRDISGGRIAGVVLVIVGALLVRKF